MVLQQKIDELIFNLDLRRINFDCLFMFTVYLIFRFSLKVDINSYLNELIFDSLLNEPISLIGYSLSNSTKVVGAQDSIMKNNRSLIVKYVTAIQHKV